MKCSKDQTCDMRKKIVLIPRFVTEEASGIPDSIMADFMTFDKSAGGHPIISFKFCPWCGEPWYATGTVVEPDTESGEEWKS